MTVPHRPLAIRELPSTDRPVSRLIELGPEALGDAELLAIIGGVRTLEACQILLARMSGWDGLRRALLSDLTANPGITEQMAAQIKAACELHRRLTYADCGTPVRISSPADAAPLAVAELGHLDQQRLIAFALDARNRLITLHVVYQGDVSTAMVRAGEVFKEAVRRNAAAILIAHNHTHGDPTPSPDDILLTRQLVEAGKLLDIEVIDSLVVAGVRWVSMRERGMGFAL